ncbi:MAG: type III-A CRISPR-associated RAMP protein Csm3 [Anaerolinea sp. 4484_236]|nr:MAG: type III-A CRISPR-associated RAMP protein Csm3 [Anaerolinea sp. 4484_236]
MTDIQLYGRIFITANIEAVTGLHIGGSGAGLEIGGIDNEVIRNPLNNQPYIPGSSLRGKMRSQTERVLGSIQNTTIGKNVEIHTCQEKEDFTANGGCPICHIFGLPGERDFSEPGRLLVRDVALTAESIDKMNKAKTDLPFAELKTEVAIDRVTSAATPRTLERVPAGAVFGPAELVFCIYDEADFTRLEHVLNAMQLVEDDYLGGSGSRGSGKVKFSNVKITARSGKQYGTEHLFEDGKAFDAVQDVIKLFDALNKWAQEIISTE